MNEKRIHIIEYNDGSISIKDLSKQGEKTYQLNKKIKNEIIVLIEGAVLEEVNLMLETGQYKTSSLIEDILSRQIINGVKYNYPRCNS